MLLAFTQLLDVIKNKVFQKSLYVYIIIHVSVCLFVRVSACLSFYASYFIKKS